MNLGRYAHGWPLNLQYWVTPLLGRENEQR